MCVCVCTLSCSVVSNSATPWTGAHQVPQPMTFSRQEYQSSLPFSSPADLPDPGIELTSPVSPALAGGFFTTEPPGKPILNIRSPQLICLITRSLYPFTSISPFPAKLPGGLPRKESTCNVEDPHSIPGSGRSPGEGNGNLLQYSCLGNPMDRGGWWATVHGIA